MLNILIEDKMGNQIKFSSKSKEKSLSGENDEYHALEIKNIQLKNTNRKLISKLDQHKKLIKTLSEELESIKKNREFIDFNKLKGEYQTLQKKNKDLENLFIQSKKENRKLKKELKKLTDESSKNTKNSPWSKFKNLRN